MAQGARRPPRHSRINSALVSKNESRAKRSHDAFAIYDGDDETVTYIKQVLCAEHRTSDGRSASVTPEVKKRSLQDLLPPLTSSNEVDTQLYAFTAVIISQLVQSWYNKITPDQDFVREVLRILAHCSLGLEQRIRCLDLESILLDDVPGLLLNQLDAVETASRVTGNSNDTNHTRHVFNILRPHAALTPAPISLGTSVEQSDSEIAWSQSLVSRILPLVISPEDYLNPSLQVLTSEIFSELVLHNGICGKACEAWMIWEGVTKVIYALRPELMPHESGTSSAAVDRLEQFGLLTATATSNTHASHAQSRRSSINSITHTFWSLLNGISLVWVLLCRLVTNLAQIERAPSYSDRSTTTSQLPRTQSITRKDLQPQRITEEGDIFNKRPLVAMNVWACLSRLTRLDQRMPWLTGLMSLLQWLSLHGPGKVCGTNSRLDRLMSSFVHDMVTDPSWLPMALRASRKAFFPDNKLATGRPPPSIEEVTGIKRECVRAIIEIIPDHSRARFFSTWDRALMEQDIETTLDLFADSYINKALIISLVELLAIKLFPELLRS